MSRTKHVMDEIRQKLTTSIIEVLLLQESYANGAKPQILGTSIKILTAGNPNEYQWATIAIGNPQIVATNLKHLESSHLVVS